MHKSTFALLALLLAIPARDAHGQQPDTDRLIAAGAIRGRLMLDRSTPLAHAIVYLSGTQSFTTAAADGAFELTDLAAGNYTLAVASTALDSLQLKYLWTTVRVGAGTTEIGVLLPVYRELTEPAPVIQVLAAASLAPVAAARLRSRATSGFTARDGTVKLDARTLVAGDTIHISGTGFRGAVITLAELVRKDFTIALDGEVFALDSIDVRGVAEGDATEQLVTNSMNYIPHEVIRDYERRGGRFEDILRARLPGVKVYRDPRVPRLCIYSGRGPTRIQPSACSTVALFVDGVRVEGIDEYLYQRGLEDVDTIEFLTAAHAGWRYGLAAGMDGVLVIKTRRAR